MPRLPRLLLPQSYYHIMTRGNNRHRIFECAKDYLYYLDLAARYKLDHPFDLYHYCLMPNHIHLQIQTRSIQDFATFMKRLNLAYFHHYRQEYGWAGHFWQGRYKSQPIGKDSYFIQTGKYIELNPIRSGLVKDLKIYPWSSYRYYAMGEKNALITQDMFYQDLGRNNIQRQKSYKNLVIDTALADSYLKTVWGSNIQRYREQQKINRKLKNPKV